MAENVLKIAQKKVKIPIKAIYVRETGNIFLGCEKLLHRHDLRICDLKHCPERKKCRAYKGAKELKHSLGLVVSRRKKEPEEVFEAPVRKRRRRMEKVEEKKFFAPINQRTGEPYFEVPTNGWEGKWEVGVPSFLKPKRIKRRRRKKNGIQ